MRRGDDGPHRIFLKPVFLPDEDPRYNKVIKGVAVEDEKNVPIELYAFQAFKADVIVYIPDLPVF